MMDHSEENVNKPDSFNQRYMQLLEIRISKRKQCEEMMEHVQKFQYLCSKI